MIFRRITSLLILLALTTILTVAQDETVIDISFGERFKGDDWSDVEEQDGIEFRWMDETESLVVVDLDPQPLTIEFRVLGAFIDIGAIETLTVTFNEQPLLLTRTEEENFHIWGKWLFRL